MGFYEKRVFPWLNDRVNRGPVLRAREEALAPARGRVLEIGFGTGANLVHYPAAVTSLVGVEPSAGMRARAARRTKERRFPVELITPWIEDRDGRSFLCIPGHLGYPVTSESFDRVRRG